MSRLIIIVAILSILGLLVPFALYAQNQQGSISGTVYRDLNANGVCDNEGEPPVAANIPLEMVQDDEGEMVRISSAANGTYTFSTGTLGLWRVTVVPGEGWRVTSQQTREVVLTADISNVNNINFCIVQVEISPPGGTLPESGAPVAPALIITAGSGLLLVLAGGGLLLRNGRQKAKAG